MESAVPNLDVGCCRTRQERLRRTLAERRLEAALIGDRRHVYYLTGFWSRSLYSPLLLLERDGGVTLSAPLDPSLEVAVDDLVVYASNKLGTLVEDQPAAAREPLQSRLAKHAKIGVDAAPALGGVSANCEDIRSALWSLRRAKDPDEVELIRFAVKATEAAYAHAIQSLRPGLSEVELFAGMTAAVAEAVGEPIGELGNDFQVGSPGGLPRRRAAEAGEVAVLDLSVNVRGYTSDLCRSFVVGGRPNEHQQAAQERIASVLEAVEKLIRPGMSCRRLFDEAAAQLEGFHGWRFGHHLGHGIGLSAHESPRLNPHWDDALEVHDVFTVEPGLYGEELRSGLRIEQNYTLSDAGLDRLSSFPIGLA